MHLLLQTRPLAVQGGRILDISARLVVQRAGIQLQDGSQTRSPSLKELAEDFKNTAGDSFTVRNLTCEDIPLIEPYGFPWRCPVNC